MHYQNRGAEIEGDKERLLPLTVKQQGHRLDTWGGLLANISNANP
jgi:hypothetical protein